MAGIQTEGDGRTWQKITNPPTGPLTSKTSGWTADSFSGGLEVDFSAVVPIDAIAVRCVVNVIDTTNNNSYCFYRKYGDSNISNTPYSSSEWSHIIGFVDSAQSIIVVPMYLSSDCKIQIAVRYTDMDVYVYYPHEVLL